MDAPINRFVVSLRGHYFRRQIVRRAAKSPCNIRYVFCKAEIGNLDMPVSVEEQIFWLQVAINDVQSMQIIECKSNFSGVELCNRVRESL